MPNEPPLIPYFEIIDDNDTPVRQLLNNWREALSSKTNDKFYEETDPRILAMREKIDKELAEHGLPPISDPGWQLELELEYVSEDEATTHKIRIDYD